MVKIKNTSKARGEPVGRGKGKEQTAKSREQRAGSLMPKIRLTGHDGPARLCHSGGYVLTSSSGPPGLKPIRGAPAWLARGKKKPLPTSPKERGEERSRGMPWLARGTPIRAGRQELEERSRGKPGEGVNALMLAPIEAIGGMNEDGYRGPYARGMPGKAGRPEPEAGSQPPVAGGKPPDARDRGHPPKTEYDDFHRAEKARNGINM